MVDGNPAQAFPVVNADGTWYYPFAPHITAAAGVDVPGQASGITFADFSVYGDWNKYAGAAAARHLTNWPAIPNVGIPGTGFNVKDWMRANLRNVVAKGYQLAGDEVLAVVMYEYDEQRSGPDGLGYELEVFTAQPTGSAQFTAGRVHPGPKAQWIIAVGIIAGLVAFVPGARDAILQLIETVGKAVAAPVQAASQGPAVILVGAGAALLALAYFLNNQPQFGGEEGFKRAREVAGSAGKLSEDVSGLGAVERTAKTAGTVVGVARGGT